jgi:magnesium transporter
MSDPEENSMDVEELLGAPMDVDEVLEAAEMEAAEEEREREAEREAEEEDRDRDRDRDRLPEPPTATSGILVRRLVYDATGCEETVYTEIDGDCAPARGKITWLHVIGLGNFDVLRVVGEAYGLHPLVLEDIINTEQRPKFEDLDTYVHIGLKTLALEHGDEIEIEQASVVLGHGWVLSFEERLDEVFGPVRARLLAGRGRIRSLGADYLAHALIDTIVDRYFVVVEELADRIENIEAEVLGHTDPGTLRDLQSIKTGLLFLRRAVWPLREVISALSRGGTDLVQQSTRIYFDDIYEHIIQIVDTVETLREMASSLVDIYLSSASNRMNEIMKVLTVISTIFMPLTFIAGVYGMNFHFMPEIPWRWGYPVTLVVMFAIAGLMLAYFKRRRWW